MILFKLSKPKVTKKANVTHVNEKAPVVKGERKQVQAMRQPDSALVDRRATEPGNHAPQLCNSPVPPASRLDQTASGLTFDVVDDVGALG